MSPLRVLVVDDDAAVRRALARMLRAAGCAAEEEPDGEAALRRLAVDDAFDLLIVDDAMPGLRGPEVIRTVRQRWPGVPAVLCSGAGGAEGLPPGVALLPKPFTVDDLHGLLRRLDYPSPQARR